MNVKTIIIPILVLSYYHISAQNMFRTACQGNLDRLDSLLQHESIHVEDDRGRSLLHWAVACKEKEVLDYLIQKGIKVNQEDHQNRTAMNVAVHFNNEPFFERLLNLQPDDKWTRIYGPSLMETAILRDHKAIVRKLVASGVDVNDTNQRGSTPLEIAKRLQNEDIIEVLLTLGADETKVRSFQMKGAYMGQKPPKRKSKRFAPNFISTEESEFGAVFNKAGDEFFFGVDVNGKNEIRYSKRIENVWSQPVTILSHERYGYNDPFLSNDENRLYFISKQALDGQGELKDVDIWYVEKEKDGWSLPVNAGPNINSDRNEYYISFTENGTMYYSTNANAPQERKQSDYDVCYSKLVDGKFQQPIFLGEAINTEAYEADVFIAPDESYIIFCSTRENGFGRGDLYISFKKDDSSWTSSVNMGDKINTHHYEYCPFVSKDGKYLFYTSNQDIYWISTKVFRSLRPKNR